jgi:hypothetical protein
MDDRYHFLDLLGEQRNRFDEIDNIDKGRYRENAASTSTYISTTDNSPNFTNINNISSPVKVKKSKKSHRRKYSSSSSSSDNDSSSFSSGSDVRE